MKEEKPLMTFPEAINLRYGAYPLELQLRFAFKELLLIGYDPDKVVKYTGNIKSFFEFFQRAKIFHGIEQTEQKKEKKKNTFEQRKIGNTTITTMSGTDGIDDQLAKMQQMGGLTYGRPR